MSNDPSSLRRALLGLESARSVRCYHCGEENEVSPKAQSVSCHACYQQLNTADIGVRAMHWGGSLRTTGVVVLHRKARVVCHDIVASLGVRVLGQVEADIRSGGPVYVGPEAELKGAVRASKLIIESGAIVSGGPFCVPSPFVLGDSVRTVRESADAA